jgi:hypothetical protein
MIALESLARLVQQAEDEAFATVEAVRRTRPDLQRVPSSASISCNRISTYEKALPVSVAS